MELLPTTIIAKEFPPHPTRSFFLLSCDSWQALAESLRPSSEYVGLLIPADASSNSDQTISEVAKRILERGLASLCTWGLDCERVHDIFDSAILAYESDHARGPRWGPHNVLMTTWHSKESFAEALWYFVYCAAPTEYFEQTCADWVIAVVRNKEFERIVRDEMPRIELRAKKYMDTKE